MPLPRLIEIETSEAIFIMKIIRDYVRCAGPAGISPKDQEDIMTLCQRIQSRMETLFNA